MLTQESAILENRTLTYSWNMVGNRFRTSLDECLPGLNAKLSQFIIFALAVLLQQNHNSIDVIAQTMTSLTTATIKHTHTFN